ncbi:MAG: hypothetical protein BWY74_03941 [Firmicutes bacterium ADurb.Bin419]|nr:MAG: hypothetical protein BWY74_03941 [Firmicutes bacterium ADurb.Bin419]
MYDYFYNPQYNLYSRQPSAPSYIRLMHASPNAPAVDVYANGSPIARNLGYRQFTEYFAIPGGNYNIVVYPSGQTTNPVLSTNINIPGGSIFTVSATGLSPNITLLPIEEPRMNIPSGKLMLRFVHLSPNAPNVDLVMQSGVVAFSNVAYQGITQYIPVDPGTYTFNLNVAGTGQRVLYVPNIRLEAGRFYTVYAIGIAAGTPPLQVLIPLDGNTYIK